MNKVFKVQIKKASEAQSWVDAITQTHNASNLPNPAIKQMLVIALSVHKLAILECSQKNPLFQVQNSNKTPTKFCSFYHWLFLCSI